MRIALLGFHFGEYSFCLADSLARQGHDVLLGLEEENFASEFDGRKVETPSNMDIFTLRWQPSARGVLRNARLITRALTEFSPEVIHVQEATHDFLALAMPVVRRWPYALTVHDPLPHSGEGYSGLIRSRRRLYERWGRLAGDHIFVHGSGLASLLQRRYPSLRASVSVVPHGALGVLPDDPPVDQVNPSGVVSFLGRMQEYKGLSVFIEALETLSRRGCDPKAIVAGSGPSLTSCRERLQALAGCSVEEGYISRSRMIGIVDESVVVVLPYLDGTQSGIGALAIGRNRPLIATAVGSLPDLVPDQRNGILVPPGDVVALADAIQRFRTDDALAIRASLAAKGIAATDLSWGTVAERTVEGYSSAIESAVARGVVKHHGV